MNIPRIIQGGMGVGVSNYLLARAVAKAGGLGVVSGTILSHVLAHRLWLGDFTGDMRRALAHFPFQDVASRIIREFFVPGGSKDQFRNIPMYSEKENKKLIELTVAGNFVEVWLAKEGHNNPIGINYLEKVQMPHLYSIYGAMLAGVSVVIMGAGIPLQIPDVLDGFSSGVKASYKLSVTGKTKEYILTFVSELMFGDTVPKSLPKPLFFPIVSSATLAEIMMKKTGGRIDGFVVEGPTAGGHNAPPRGKPVFNDRGEPIYGVRDELDVEHMRRVGKLFWLAGAYASPEKVRYALSLGASGIQAGSIFALCDESGMRPDLKQQLLLKGLNGSLDVLTDARASSSGFPFKVAQLEGTLSDHEVYLSRTRICDLGHLRELYERSDGKLGFRCSAEPVVKFVQKGGAIADTEGRKCLCNALMANVGLGGDELPLQTIGDDVSFVRELLGGTGRNSYTAAQAIAYLSQ